VPYIFVAASVISVFAIIFVIKWSLDKIKRNPDVNIEKVQQNMFIGVALAESIPIILVVVGLTTLAPAYELNELLTPLGIVILLAAFAIFFIKLQTTIGVPEKLKGRIQLIGFIGIGLVIPVPMVSAIVFILRML